MIVASFPTPAGVSQPIPYMPKGVFNHTIRGLTAIGARNTEVTVSKRHVTMKTLTRNSFVTATLVLAGLSLPLRSHATSIIQTGWDLLATQPGTQFMGVPFQGVPIGSYDFGGGLQNVGNADTIVQRLATANGPAQTIPIELVALQLKSVIPVDFGLGVGIYYITLQSDRGGPASPGSMTINFGPEANPHGTFDSFFDVFFDLRLGGLDGPIAFSGDLPLTSTSTPWTHLAPSGAVLIDGVNHNLNNSNNGEDFWSGGTITHEHPNGLGTHVVDMAKRVPDTGTTLSLLMIAIGICSCGQFIKKSQIVLKFL